MKRAGGAPHVAAGAASGTPELVSGAAAESSEASGAAASAGGAVNPESTFGIGTVEPVSSVEASGTGGARPPLPSGVELLHAPAAIVTTGVAARE